MAVPEPDTHAHRSRGGVNGLDQVGKLREPFTQPCAQLGLIGKQAEISEVETGTHGATDQRVRSGGPRSLPAAGWNRGDGRIILRCGSQNMAIQAREISIESKQFEGSAFDEVPYFVRPKAMPAAGTVVDEEEEDAGEGGARFPLIVRVHRRGRAEDLPVITTLRVGLELQPVYERCDLRVQEATPGRA